MNYSEPSWEDIFFEIYPHLRKDTTFTGKDIIRFFERNLNWLEREEVLNYFSEFCDEETPLPEVFPDPPKLPFLPIPIIPTYQPPVLPPPPPTALPPPKTPLLPEFLIPFFPFIIVPLLPPDILKFLKESIGVREAHASEIDWESRYYEMRGWYNDLLKENVELSQLVKYHEFTSMIGPRTEEVTITNTIVNVYPAWDDEGKYTSYEVQKLLDLIDSLKKGYEEEIEDLLKELEEAKEISTGQDDLPPDDIPSIVDQNRFYRILEELEHEGDRLGIFIEWRFWTAGTWGEIWYFFTIDGEDYEYTLDELEDLLDEWRQIQIDDTIKSV